MFHRRPLTGRVFNSYRFPSALMRLRSASMATNANFRIVHNAQAQQFEMHFPDGGIVFDADATSKRSGFTYAETQANPVCYSTNERGISLIFTIRQVDFCVGHDGDKMIFECM